MSIANLPGLGVVDAGLSSLLMLEDITIQRNHKDKDGRIALTVAAQRGDKELVQHILETKAKLMVEDAGHIGQIMAEKVYLGLYNRVVPAKEPARSAVLDSVVGETPLSCALRLRHVEVARLLVEGPEGVNRALAKRIRLEQLHWAVYYGQLPIIDHLLLEETDIEGVNADGITPLGTAVSRCQAAVVDVLLRKYKANVNAKEEDGTTLLHYLFLQMEPETKQSGAWKGVMKRLIDEGADLDARTEPNGGTILHHISWIDRIEEVQLLLEYGADVNASDKMGLTALHVAASMGHVKIVELLLQHGAKCEASGPSDYTPLDLLLKPDPIPRSKKTPISNRVRVVRLLLNSNPGLLMKKDKFGFTSVGTAIHRSELELLEVLLDYSGSDPGQSSVNLSTMCFAALLGTVDVIEFLIKKGVSLQGVDERYGRNALCWAVSRGRKAQFMSLLRSPRMGWDDVDKLGRNALFLAAANGEHDMFVQLADRDSDVHRRDRFGLTPLFVAVQHGHLSIVRQIVESRPLLLEPKDSFGRSLSWWMRATGNTSMQSILTGTGMQLQDDEQTGDILSFLEKTSSIECDVCTLCLYQKDRGVQCGSGIRKYRICHVCCDFGASAADFADLLEG
ncbi:ankyrin repeat-containing domain protein [Aspergillus candidus]|uniref:Ankyrin repeat-containing domain protein n=1 Tax=Aspergillus candidus TaxID=41067 RepID=A0A2I2FAG1_ASPCN|nr:ankyrin repeat-containing domain protein [Aspergillus candidus]PLB37608.1 ankyrin repeat-containing domain protein [Aspergillus candidus]